MKAKTPYTARRLWLISEFFSRFVELPFAGNQIFLCVICNLIMAKLKRLSNEMFYDSFGYFILGEIVPEFLYWLNSSNYRNLSCIFMLEFNNNLFYCLNSMSLVHSSITHLLQYVISHFDVPLNY